MRARTAWRVPTFASRSTIGSQTLLALTHCSHKAGTSDARVSCISGPSACAQLYRYSGTETDARVTPRHVSRAAVALGAKRLAQRRGVALRSTAAYDALTKEPAK